MLLYIGAINISMALGAVIMIVFMAFGMMTGNLPYEMLPTFWQDWIYPWAPQHYISEGIRSVIYLGDGAWNRASLPLLIYGLAGIVLAVIAGLIPHKTDEEKAAARKELHDASDKELKEAKEAADEA
ncbi:MAG: hypothetical protein LUD25_02810 [Coriobacteriaceae bacterium]|nr:hypothetical protein [Coriobacteriaceae bacterium]